uniref:Serine/threonine-protein phosphatase 1 regulatory subunit 10 n=1 Tax=Zeugodacus cucurbitae TaxID=28588 RepID=A0A0A1WIZ7_ZEUCU
MPRIVPLQLLKCLKVLLDDNGGILSIGEVKRIAGLMNRYSKKLVSKCIYVQILKVTKTELLGEFMGVGGWSLVYNWLNDAIRAMNWPLVQEILELLLLCPVDVDRLKINSAPKLVKGLCRDGGNEGVRILAKRLVEQWLKVVTENTTASQADSTTEPSVVGGTTPSIVSTSPAIQTTPVNRQDSKIPPNSNIPIKVKGPAVAQRQSSNSVEQDPLADVTDVPPEPSTYAPTPAQKKASEAGLVFKLIYKDGQQVLTKVPKTNQVTASVGEGEPNEQGNVNEDECEKMDHDAEVEASMNGDAGTEVGLDDQEEEDENDRGAESTMIEDEEDTRTSVDKHEKDSESSADDESQITPDNNNLSTEQSTAIRKKSIDTESEKSVSKEHRSSKDSRDSKNKDKENKGDKDRKSSSSSSHKSSSHKSKSSSSSKSKSSSSSSSHRSSSDKHRSDRDRSSSSKDKDRKEGGSSSSSSSSKHRSSSSSSSKYSSSTSSKDKHRDKDKDKSANTSSSHKKEKEREKETQNDKDKETSSKLSSITEKLGRIPKKHKDESETDVTKPTSITIPSKKASMSIEIRRDSEKAKTVKTYKSQFRSHGLTEEAPPPPSRKGLKKPASSVSAPGTVIPTSLPSSLKRPSPPPSSSDSPTQKKSKIDINNLTVANEKPGAIKLIAPKKSKYFVLRHLLMAFCVISLQEFG